MTKPGFGNAKISRKFRLRNRFQNENVDVWMFGCLDVWMFECICSPYYGLDWSDRAASNRPNQHTKFHNSSLSDRLSFLTKKFSLKKRISGFSIFLFTRALGHCCCSFQFEPIDSQPHFLCRKFQFELVRFKLYSLSLLSSTSLFK